MLCNYYFYRLRGRLNGIETSRKTLSPNKKYYLRSHKFLKIPPSEQGLRFMVLYLRTPGHHPNEHETRRRTNWRKVITSDPTYYHQLESRFLSLYNPRGVLFIHFRSFYMDTIAPATTLIQENIPFHRGCLGHFLFLLP